MPTRAEILGLNKQVVKRKTATVKKSTNDKIASLQKRIKSTTQQVTKVNETLNRHNNRLAKLYEDLQALCPHRQRHLMSNGLYRCIDCDHTTPDTAWHD